MIELTANDLPADLGFELRTATEDSSLGLVSKLD